MRIAVLMNEAIVNTAYRAVGPFGALGKQGHDVVWNPLRGGVYDEQALLACDVVYVHRYYDERLQALLAGLRRRGVAIWWDNDDDICSLPRGAANYAQIGGLRGRRIFAAMVKVMRLADLVTTPSATLADIYLAQGAANVRVVENYLPPDAVISRRRRSRDAVVLGWIAGLEHAIDAERLGLAGVLAATVANFPGVEVVTVGVDLRLRESWYRHIPRVQLGEVGSVVADWDIGLAPLDDNAFNRARSNIKLKEYAAGGTPWLASPVGPYLGLGEREGGRLVPDDRWREEIARLVGSRRKRAALARRAAKWGRMQTIDRNVHAWESALHEAVRQCAGREGRAASAPAVV